MKKQKIKETPYHSHRIGSLPMGCKLCVRGEKSVLFVTGLCNRSCFYCPISDEKKNKDVVYANEWDTGFAGRLTEKQLEIIREEIRLCDSKGAGITGGDPLWVVKRTAKIIDMLKKEYGSGFHIHLYTTPENTSKDRLRILHEAGLDEIRFHPLLWDDLAWDKIDLAGEFGWSVGVEIPAIPGYEKETKKLIDFLDGRISFLNINELEVADTKANQITKRGYTTKDDASYGVCGSEELALDLMHYILEKEYQFRVHYCTCKLKDAVQMAKRIKKRAKNAAERFDKVTDEGMLIRGVLYLEEFKPSFSYRKKIKELSETEKKNLLNRLVEARAGFITEFGLAEDEIKVDEYKLRLLTSVKVAKKYGKKLNKKGFASAIVEEYPTQDGLEVDIRFL